MEPYEAYLKVVQYSTENGITPQEACAKLQIPIELFQKGNQHLQSRKQKNKQVKQTTLKNRKYANTLQPVTKERYLEAREYWKKNPDMAAPQLCEKFGISLTSFFKARRILGDTKVMKKINKTDKRKEVISGRNWDFAEDTIRKCKVGVEIQERDPSLTMGQISDKIGVSKSTFYAYRKALGIIDPNIKRLPSLKVKQKVEKQKTKALVPIPRVETIHYVEEPIVSKPKKQGLIVMGDADFLIEFAKKYEGEKDER